MLMLLCITINTHAQLSSSDAAKAMGRGINMGNTFDAPSETAWGNPAVTASNFDDYKNAGFTCVRIPITWDTHTAATSPYAINATWLNRIEQVVDWGLSRGLVIIINAHHEAWLKTDTAYASLSTKARFDSIWSQIAVRFHNKSDSLLFEVINEPYPLSSAYVNDLNARVISIMRKTNPTRIILFSGNNWSNSADLLAAAIPQDNFLIGYYHSYDPYPFGLIGTGSYGSMGDISTTAQKFYQVSSWSSQHSIPVVISEFGAIDTSKYNSRMCYYATVTQKALYYHVPFIAWEDGGDFKIYNRTQHTWNEVKDILIHTYKESPNKLAISTYADSSIKIQWHNNTTNDSGIVVERRVDNGSFIPFAQLTATDSTFIDSSTSKGKTYYYRLSMHLNDSSLLLQSYPVMIAIPLSTTSVASLNTPLHFQLYNNYPNPFNPSTTISFQLAQRSHVTLKIYDIIGRAVATVFSGELEAGDYTRQWNASAFSSGVYFYRLEAGSFVDVKKMILLK
jgi:hypothetical protein